MTTRSLPPYQRLSAPETCRSWTIPLELVTPLYGGGAQTRRIDDRTPVRASSIRGQLRFWWRALYGGVYGEADALYRRERALFGGLGPEPADVACSRVDVQVRDLVPSQIVDDNIGFGDKGAYALWPARATSHGEPAAQRWAPGLSFTLVVRLTPGPDAATDSREVERALRAWLLFGGVGGRTRRGCGALGIPDEAARTQWLPESLDASAITAWLAPGKAAGQGYPSLAGSRLGVGRAESPMSAWYEALRWLRDFRQGTHVSRTDTEASGPHARQRPSLSQGNTGRPGRSRWPEPDLIRHLAGPRFHDHETLIPPTPTSWPRAQFGLPIQFRFQNKDRNGNSFKNRPPSPGSLDWAPDGKTPHQRLASPLIVKPVQARNGKYAGVALWLRRVLPDKATVGVQDGDTLRGAAPMTRMPSAPLFTPLAGKASTEDAFMDWLQTAQRLNGGTL